MFQQNWQNHLLFDVKNKNWNEAVQQSANGAHAGLIKNIAINSFWSGYCFKSFMYLQEAL